VKKISAAEVNFHGMRGGIFRRRSTTHPRNPNTLKIDKSPISRKQFSRKQQPSYLKLNGKHDIDQVVYIDTLPLQMFIW